jgi:DNA invertase Pin-like site-specific DNA recombinase
MERFISYYRVSTDKQGRSGLGIDAQKSAVESYIEGKGRLLGSYTEVESGKANSRPQLAAALARCRLTGAILIVAKLDRLSRNSSFLMSIYEGTGSAGVVFCDLPNIPAGPVGKFIVQQMANVAELEAGLISARTKAALAEAKASGKQLGGFRGHVVDCRLASEARQLAADARARDLAPLILELRQAGSSLHQIARELTAQGIRTPRGGQWTPAAVRSVLLRLAAPEALGEAA